MERIFGHENMRSGPPMMAYDDHSVFQLACGGVYLFLGCQDTKWTDKGLESLDPNKPIPVNHNPPLLREGRGAQDGYPYARQRGNGLPQR